MNPVKIVAPLLALCAVGAVVQTATAPRPGKKLALASIRYALEERARTDRDGLMRDALAARQELLRSEDLDIVFRDVTLVWLAREPSDDLKRPTVAEVKALPISEALAAVRRLTPDTGFEGARIRSLYEARRKTPREQQPILARLVSNSPGDFSAVRAYTAALRIGEPEERRKAIEIARGYVRNDEGSAIARLTLLLAIRESLRGGDDPKLRTEARGLADSLRRDVPADSFAAESVRGMTIELEPAPKR